MLGKGAGGLGLPAAVGVGYVAMTAKWKDLVTMEIPAGLLVVAVVAVPWYLAMFARHGHPFTDELIFQHMYKRAFEHVHDTNLGDDVSFRYYVWQLGYALFPWSGFAALGLVWWKSQRDPDSRETAAVFFVTWFVLAFGLFAAMPTKFHHYIFPAVPPTAVLTGVALDRLLGHGGIARRLAPYLAVVGSGAWMMLYGCAHLALSILHSSQPGLWGGGTLVLAGFGVASLGAHRFGLRDAKREELTDSSARHESSMIGGPGIAGALIITLVGRDLIASDGDLQGEQRLLGLFTYNYHRAWPPSLDFGGALAGTAGFVAMLLFGLTFRFLRRHIVVML